MRGRPKPCASTIEEYVWVDSMLGEWQCVCVYMCVCVCMYVRVFVYSKGIREVYSVRPSEPTGETYCRGHKNTTRKRKVNVRKLHMTCVKMDTVVSATFNILKG